MYQVKVDMLDIANNQVIALYVERFANMIDAQISYVAKVNKYCINRDCTVEYDITLAEIEPKEGHNDIIYRSICK